MANRAWFRPAQRMPVEGWFVVVLVTAAWVLCALAAPPRPAVTASIAPTCADAPQPCRGVR